MGRKEGERGEERAEGEGECEKSVTDLPESTATPAAPRA